MRRLMLLFLAIVAVTTAGCDGESAPDHQPLGEWIETAPSPLSPRARTTIAWTGSSILVVGGDEVTCPSHMDCAPPDDPPRSDAAIYDPELNEWQRVADAPMPVRFARSASLDGDVFLLAWANMSSDPTLLHYELDTDRWTAHSLPPSATVNRIVATDSAVALFKGSHEAGLDPDLVFDPRTATWTELAESPLGAGFDRRLIWVDGALYLFDHELVASPGGADGPSLVRVARLDGDREALPTGGTLGSDLYLVDSTRVIFPALGCADGGATNGYGRCIPYGAVFDTATGRWSELPHVAQNEGQETTYAGAIGADGLALHFDGTPIFDAATDTWFDMPPLPAAEFRDLSTAGRFAFTFGGVSLGDGTSGLEPLGDAWIWHPPPPR